MCCNCSTKQQKLTLFSIAGVLMVIGVILVAAWRFAAMEIIRLELPLTPTSYTFKQWVDTPVPVYLTFYLYNWTNPEEVDNPLVKPHFEELGPYAFRDVKHKEDLAWDYQESTVTYYGRRFWYFDPEISNGNLDDIVTQPHIPSVTAAKNARGMGKSMRKIANFTLEREGGSLTTTHTAIEWMFDGFYDHLLDFVERMHSPLFPVYSNQFAWLYGRNGSKEAEGTFTVHTGQKDLYQMGDLLLWNGSDHTGFWEGECGKVNGSTGELWSPEKKWDDALTIFYADAARYLNLFPQERVNYKGVQSWLYTSTNQTFDSGYIAPDTKCFCVPGNECPKNGVIDFSPVAIGAPMYMSHPHFYMADPMYLENTTGLSPNPQKHGIYILMEPNLAVPLKVNGQVMLSLLVEQDEAIDIFRDVAHNIYAPLMVLQMSTEISDDIFNYVKFVLSVPDIGEYLGIALLIVGLVMAVTGICFIQAGRWQSDVSVENEIECGLEENTEHELKEEVVGASDNAEEDKTQSQDIANNKAETSNATGVISDVEDAIENVKTKELKENNVENNVGLEIKNDEKSEAENAKENGVTNENK